jgi:hypothetical protein
VQDKKKLVVSKSAIQLLETINHSLGVNDEPIKVSTRVRPSPKNNTNALDSDLYVYD